MKPTTIIAKCCRKHLSRPLIHAGLLLTALCTFASCAQDQEIESKHSNIIGFDIRESHSAEEVASQSHAIRTLQSDTTQAPSSLTNYEVFEMTGGDQPYYLHVEEEDGIDSSPLTQNSSALLTRAAPVTNQNMYENIGVFASEWRDGSAWSDTKPLNFIYDLTVTKSSKWHTNVSWPGAGKKLRFFAYAPKGAAGIGEFAGKGELGSPTLTYVVPTNVAQQSDLIVASPTRDYPGDFRGAVDLTFRHICTAVRFITNKDALPGKITGITIEGVYNHGTFSLHASDWTQDKSKKGTFRQNLNVNVRGGAGQNITEEATTFMMLPQTLPFGAKIKVDYEYYGQKRTLETGIAYSRWERGKTKTYRIGIRSIREDYDLDVRLNNEQVDSWTAPLKVGGRLDIQVVSERKIKTTGGVHLHTAQAPWTAEFSTDDGENWTSTAPAWLTNHTTTGTGSTTLRNVTLAAQPAYDFVTILRNTPPKNDDWVNLADPEGTGRQTTANCYMVNAAGYYEFPLVYGNGITNGEENPSAYKYTHEYGEGGDMYEFYKHNSTKRERFIRIKSANIRDSKNLNDGSLSPHSVELLWQYPRSLIKYVDLAWNTIRFQIEQQNLHQGNALIALKDRSGRIMWSWHIWVTPIHPQRDVLQLRSPGKPSYDALPCPLGWIEEGRGYYSPRQVKVRVTQQRRDGRKGQSREFTLRQSLHIETSQSGYNPFYQWGRKSPFLARAEGSIANHTLYNINGHNVNYITSNRWESVGVTIRHPMTYIVSTTNWTSTNGMNMWNNDILGTDARNNSNSSPIYTYQNVGLKTVYDPCPPGFMVSPVGFFNSYFVDRLSPYISLPGYIENTSAELKGKGSEGSFWCSWSSQERLSVILGYDYIGVKYQINNANNGVTRQYTAFGNSVWPVKIQ